MPHFLTARNGKVESVHYPNQTHYEWWIEVLDEHEISTDEYGRLQGDIIDCHEALNKEDALAASNKPNHCVSLRRIFSNEAEGILDWGYAYIIDGVLETEFCSGQKVPARFLKQVNGDTK